MGGYVLNAENVLQKKSSQFLRDRIFIGLYSQPRGLHCLQKSFTDITLLPGIAPPLWPCSPLRPNVTSSIKPDIHNVSQRHWRRTKPRPQGICIENFAKIGPAIPEICSRIDRHTDRPTDHNTPLTYRAGVKRKYTSITNMYIGVVWQSCSYWY